MKITWLGHSAFELFSHGVKILIDPFLRAILLRAIPKRSSILI